MEKSLFSKYLPDEIYSLLLEEGEAFLKKVTEIRLRVEKPIIVYSSNNEKILNHKVSQILIKKTLELISGYSLYAWEDELRTGFITLPGGCRVGICGKTVVENDKIKTITHISGINIRIKHEIKGCANVIFKLIPTLAHTMIISPPGCGKTTLLRDLAGQISNKGKTVGIVDERSEIAGSYMGVPQNDVGMRTDVLDRCPKDKGMIMLLRSMSPQFIIVDEIGSKKDIEAIEQLVNAGVKIICTVHGNGIDDIRGRSVFKSLEGLFDNYIVLSASNGPGTIEGVYNKNFEVVRLC
ncbi:MAG: stage III sporulation protein AA [Defluviitaleaceae bacterium]|nr:stage III sporulation protein AA [Defluviitaleaceae bacterium]